MPPDYVKLHYLVIINESYRYIIFARDRIFAVELAMKDHQELFPNSEAINNVYIQSCPDSSILDYQVLYHVR